MFIRKNIITKEYKMITQNFTVNNKSGQSCFNKTMSHNYIFYHICFSNKAEIQWTITS